MTPLSDFITFLYQLEVDLMDWGEGLIEDSGKGEFPHFSIIYFEELFNLTVLLRYYAIWVSFYFIFRVFVVSNIYCVNRCNKLTAIQIREPFGPVISKNKKKKNAIHITRRKNLIPFLSGFVVRQIVSKHFEYFPNLYFRHF